MTGRRELSDFNWFRRALPAIETRNGAMLGLANRNAETLCRWLGKAPLGGSDAHTLENAGAVWTRVRGARDLSEYLEGLRQRRGVVYGGSGGYRALTRTVLRIACELMKETPWTRALAPLLIGLPVVMLLNYLEEARFALHWNRRLQAAWGIPGSGQPWILRKASGEGPV